MRLVSAIAALTVVGGVAHMVTDAPTALASVVCTPQVQEDGSMIYANVIDAKPIKKPPKHGRAIVPKWTAGAKMYVTATKGMTGEYLNRAAICHANATNVDSYVNDPLRVDGEIKSIRVYSSGSSFVISVTSDDKATGREIWRRAEALTSEVDAGYAKR